MGLRVCDSTLRKPLDSLLLSHVVEFDRTDMFDNVHAAHYDGTWESMGESLLLSFPLTLVTA